MGGGLAYYPKAVIDQLRCEAAKQGQECNPVLKNSEVGSRHQVVNWLGKTCGFRDLGSRKDGLNHLSTRKGYRHSVWYLLPMQWHWPNGVSRKCKIQPSRKVQMHTLFNWLVLHLVFWSRTDRPRARDHKIFDLQRFWLLSPNTLPTLPWRPCNT